MRDFISMIPFFLILGIWQSMKKFNSLPFVAYGDWCTSFLKSPSYKQRCHFKILRDLLFVKEGNTMSPCLNVLLLRVRNSRQRLYKGIDDIFPNTTKVFYPWLMDLTLLFHRPYPCLYELIYKAVYKLTKVRRIVE